MAIELFPCPARVRHEAYLAQYKRDYKTLIKKGVEMAKRGPMLVITGSDRNDFSNNCGLAKTTLAQVIEGELQLNEGRSVLWMNFEQQLEDRRGRPFRNRDLEFNKMLFSGESIPSPGDFCFIDEAHLLFPYADLKDRGLKADNRVAISFLEKLPAMLRKGIRFIFITSANPLDPLYRQKLVSRELAGFFTAPSIELDADGPHYRPRFVIT